MRTTILTIVCLFTGAAYSTAQGTTIESAFAQGDAASLSPYLARAVDLVIFNDESSYNAKETVTMLAEFFNKSGGVKSYKQNHLSSSQNGRSTYSIGDLVTSQGVYRLSLFYNSEKKISEIRIEK